MRESTWSRFLPLLALAPCLAWVGGAIIQHDIWISDLLHSQLPYRAYLGESLRAGHFPLWMPDIFSGVPFLSQIEAGGLYPPHLLIFALLEPLSALNVALGLDMLLMALGAAALARCYGATTAASALAAVVYAWSGFSISHFRHINMHAAAALLPWMVLALERLIEGRSRAGIGLAVLIGLQLLAGHPQITWIALLLLGVRTAAALPAAPDRMRIAASALSAVLLGAGLSAVQLLPVAAFTGQSLATVAPTWEYAAAYSYRFEDLLTWVYPPAVGAMETFDYIGGGTIPWGNYGYCGLAVLVLSPLGVIDRRLRFWAAAGLLSLVLVMGPLTPIYRLLWEIIPGMKLFRFPTRFLMTASLALAVLGAVGLTRIARRRPWLVLPVVALSLVDLTWHASPRIPIDAAAAWSAASPIARTLQPGTERVYTLEEFDLWEDAFFASEGFRKGFGVYQQFWQIPMGSSGVLSGIRSPSGYARMVHFRCAAFWQGYNWSILPERFGTTRPTQESPAAPAAFRAQLSRASVRFLLSRFPVTGEGLVLRSETPLLQYENTAALPRAYVAARWLPVANMAAAAEWMYRDGLDHPTIPATEGAPPPPDAAVEGLTAVSVTEHSDRHLSLDVTGAPQGLLVVTDTWDSGWSATVDGVPAALHIANGYQRAVILPPDAQRVTLRYWPAGLTAGLLISLASGLLLLVWGVRTTKTGRRLSSS
ncbi:MAG: YfhO family protein [Myxococcota bacterium]|nr:YfhO family protein [Myxococcota bacterium]